MNDRGPLRTHEATKEEALPEDTEHAHRTHHEIQQPESAQTVRPAEYHYHMDKYKHELEEPLAANDGLPPRFRPQQMFLGALTDVPDLLTIEFHATPQELALIMATLDITARLTTDDSKRDELLALNKRFSQSVDHAIAPDLTTRPRG